MTATAKCGTNVLIKSIFVCLIPLFHSAVSAQNETSGNRTDAANAAIECAAIANSLVGNKLSYEDVVKIVHNQAYDQALKSGKFKYKPQSRTVKTIWESTVESLLYRFQGLRDRPQIESTFEIPPSELITALSDERLIFLFDEIELTYERPVVNRPPQQVTKRISSRNLFESGIIYSNLVFGENPKTAFVTEVVSERATQTGQYKQDKEYHHPITRVQLIRYENPARRSHEILDQTNQFLPPYNASELTNRLRTPGTFVSIQYVDQFYETHLRSLNDRYYPISQFINGVVIETPNGNGVVTTDGKIIFDNAAFKTPRAITRGDDSPYQHFNSIIDVRPTGRLLNEAGAEIQRPKINEMIRYAYEKFGITWGLLRNPDMMDYDIYTDGPLNKDIVNQWKARVASTLHVPDKQLALLYLDDNGNFQFALVAPEQVTDNQSFRIIQSSGHPIEIPFRNVIKAVGTEDTRVTR